MDVKLPFVLGLAGRKGVGKTYLAKQLEERGWVRMSYADSVRDLALTLDPIIVAELEGRVEQDLLDGYGR